MLEYLTIINLKIILKRYNLPVYGNKSVLIERLSNNNISFNDLTLSELKKILIKNNLSINGNKEQLIKILKSSKKAMPKSSKKAMPKSSKKAISKSSKKAISKSSKKALPKSSKKAIVLKKSNISINVNNKEMVKKELDNIGKVYIASMNMRGKWAIPPENAIKVNVTSAQSKLSKNRRDFSPMTFNEYEGYPNFEAYWQSGKVFEGISSETIKNFWKKITPQTGAKRRYPNSKGKKVLYSEFDGEKMDYITSRKKIYVPRYYKLIKNTEMAVYWKDQVKQGKNIVIYDFDGPRLSNDDVTCLEVTIDLLKEKINYGKHPFGHGYIIAGYLLDINPEKYII
jgi:hypothetical protein